LDLLKNTAEKRSALIRHFDIFFDVLTATRRGGGVVRVREEGTPRSLIKSEYQRKNYKLAPPSSSKSQTLATLREQASEKDKKKMLCTFSEVL